MYTDNKKLAFFYLPLDTLAGFDLTTQRSRVPSSVMGGDNYIFLKVARAGSEPGIF
jgi:hypothetical protein